MKSIRRFLVIVLLAAITLINFLAAVQGYRAGMKQAEYAFDQQMEDMGKILLGLTSYQPSKPVSLNPAAVAYQIWHEARQLQDKTANTPESPIANFVAGFSYHNFNGYRWRTLSIEDQVHRRWILLAQRMDSRYILADNIILEFVLPIVLGIPIAGLVIWLIVGRGLSPLYRLAKQLHNKQADDLSPLPVTDLPKELTQVTRSTNQLLNRLANAFDREKRFAADAAHELRTPISILKVHFHNLLHDYPEFSKQFTAMRKGIERLEHLVEQMLALYRSSPDQYLAKIESINLLAAAQTTIAHYYDRLEARQQQIELVGESAWITGNPFAITMLLENLLSNASKYSPEGSHIQVTVGYTQHSALITIEDSGPGIPEDQRTRVFDRFYRIEANDEQQDIPGCGLGLAIVKHIAEQHQAILALKKSSFATGLAITIEFPLAENLPNHYLKNSGKLS